MLRERTPALQLTMASASRGLAPLGALQAALRTMSAPSLLATLATAQRGVLARCAALDSVEREAVIDAFAALLTSASAHGRIVILLPAVHELDAPSLAVLLAAVEQSGTAPAIVVPLDETASVPPLLGRIAEPVTVSLGALDARQRVEVAASVLGGAADEQVSRHVAQLGGDSVLGVMEAARTLIAAGDVVHVEGVWRFRAEPRAAHQPIPIEALLAERLLGLDDQAHRVLEAACLAPPGTPRDLAERIARLDGLPPEAVARGRRILREEGLTDEAGRLGALASSVRDAVRNAMPSARAAELSRFAASALEEDLAPLPRTCFGRALLAHYLAEGGRESEAARQLIEAAEAAVEGGFPTSALRLAALARKLDASAEGAERARAVSVDIARAAAREGDPSVPPGAPSATGSHALDALPVEERSPLAAAIDAVRADDPEAAERAIDAALAAGCEPASATLLSAVVALRRGDVADAIRALRKREVRNASRTRRALSTALVLFEAGAGFDAARSALEALSSARAASDVRGERAALEVLAACYAALDRADEARALRQAGDALR
jgi:hypothetical protein